MSERIATANMCGERIAGSLPSAFRRRITCDDNMQDAEARPSNVKLSEGRNVDVAGEAGAVCREPPVPVCRRYGSLPEPAPAGYGRLQRANVPYPQSRRCLGK